MSFKIGDIVYNSDLVCGEVIGLGKNNDPIVEFPGGNIQRIGVGRIMSEAEGLKKIQEKNSIEKEFELLQEKCASKVDEALILLREAISLGSRGKKPVYLYDLRNASELESLIDQGGWSTSSWHC